MKMFQWGFQAVATVWGVIYVKLDLVQLVSANLFSIRPFGIKFSQIWIKIQIFSFGKMQLKVSTAEYRSFRLLDVWLKDKLLKVLYLWTSFDQYGP